MTEQYKVNYSRDAIEDLRGIYTYIAETFRMPQSAASQLQRIRKKISSLEFMPARHKIVEWEPWDTLKMHQLPVDNYVIFYMINEHENAINVARILYKGRDIENILYDLKLEVQESTWITGNEKNRNILTDDNFPEYSSKIEAKIELDQ